MLSKLVSLVCSASFWTNMDFSVSSWFLSAKTRSESSRAESRSADSLSFSSSSFCCKTHHTERRWLFTKKALDKWSFGSWVQDWTSIFQAVSWNSQIKLSWLSCWCGKSSNLFSHHNQNLANHRHSEVSNEPIRFRSYCMRPTQSAGKKCGHKDIFEH